MSFLALLEQYYIMEGLDEVISRNPSIPSQVIKDYHRTSLPDNNKSDRLLDHVLKMHRSGNITPESSHLLKPHLTALSNTNQLNKLPQLNTLDDHKDATKDILDKSVTKKERIDKNTPVLLNTPDILVRQHLNHESADKAARMHPENPMYNVPTEKGKAAWCVSLGGEAGQVHFNHYTERGNLPMYTIYNKKTKRIHALVANPNDTRHTVELRNENDDRPYTVNDDLKSFISSHPGLEKTPAGLHLRRLTDEHIKQESDKVATAMTDSSKLHSALLDDEISDPKRIALLSSPHITEEHIKAIVTSPSTSPQLKINAIRNKLSDKFRMKDMHELSKPLMDILTNPSSDINLKKSIAMSPRLLQEHADHIMSGKDSTLKESLLSHNSEYVTPNHINHIMSGDNYILKTKVLNELDHKVTPQHIHDIIMEPHSQDTTNRSHQIELTKNVLKEYPQYVTADHIKHIMKVGNINEQLEAVNSDAFNIHHLSDVLQSQSPKPVIHAAFKKHIKHITLDHANIVMGSDDPSLKTHLIESRPDLINQTHINKLIKNYHQDNYSPVYASLSHTQHLITPDHVTTLLNTDSNHIKTKVLNSYPDKITNTHVNDILASNNNNLKNIVATKYSHLLPSNFVDDLVQGQHESKDKADTLDKIFTDKPELITRDHLESLMSNPHNSQNIPIEKISQHPLYQTKDYKKLIDNNTFDTMTNRIARVKVSRVQSKRKDLDTDDITNVLHLGNEQLLLNDILGNLTRQPKFNQDHRKYVQGMRYFGGSKDDRDDAALMLHE